ncbi:MAG: LysR family transcriptional regulator [Candidatus Solibacter sp.]
MELGQLRVLLAVVDAAGVTRAAETVGLTPGAISQQLRSMSVELGVELFVRSGRGIAPTAAALRLAEHARAILHQVGRMEHEFTRDEAADNRPFHFATGATALIYRLGRPLRMLRQRFPQNEILVTVAATEEIVAGLLSRRFDLGLLSMPVPEDKLTVLPLFEEELLGLRPAPARGGPKSKIARLQPSELEGVPFLLYPGRSNMRLCINKCFQQLGINPRVIMEADDTEAIKRLVESGFGYSILPEFSVRGQSRFLELFRVAGHRLARRQALAMARTEYPRPLTQRIAGVIQGALVAK